MIQFFLKMQISSDRADTLQGKEHDAFPDVLFPYNAAQKHKSRRQQERGLRDTTSYLLPLAMSLLLFATNLKLSPRTTIEKDTTSCLNSTQPSSNHFLHRNQHYARQTH